MTRIAPKKAFEILGVTPTDDFSTIRRAWIKLVKENHPDVVGGDLQELTAKLTRINEAYDSLRWHSPEKVRIREERKAEAEHQEETAQKDSGPRRSAPDPRAAHHDRRSAEPPRRDETDPSPDAHPEAATPRRQMPLGAAADRVGPVWTSLSAEERFQVAQVLCAPKTAPHDLKRPLATV
ncbi:J domain-containing protein [Antarctobacter jejuensis]|uniref:J domain-containing protein n=1 Tax=Antarctobacter jejuensis TaxID=1439938 RepID=UPI003FD35357